MKIKELIEILQGMDPERIVVLSKDAEGNGYSRLRCTDDESVFIENYDCGSVFLEELTDELRDQGFTEEDLGPIGEDLEEYQKREKAVVFSP